jgi:predicted nucleotidyltransferase
MFKKLEFITPTLMSVFEFFLCDPMREYHQREVARGARVSVGSANRILKLLADLGLLTRQRRGRMVFYKLSAGDPVVRQFKALLNVYSLRPLLQAARRHSRRIVLFGSSAQGTDVKESDIDLFLLTSEKNSARNEISEFNRKSERKIAPIIVDANEFVRLKRNDRALYENIEGGITLWQAE